MRKNEPELQAAVVSAVKDLYTTGAIVEIFKKWNVDSILLPKSFLDKCIVNCASMKVE
jgi:ABC-type amino acid transport substrate-binding protein